MENWQRLTDLLALDKKGGLAVERFHIRVNANEAYNIFKAVSCSEMCRLKSYSFCKRLSKADIRCQRQMAHQQ